MPEKVLFRQRKWLNRVGTYSNAFVFAEAVDETWKGSEGEPRRVKAYCLKIGDCDRVISLDLSTESARWKERTLFKLDTLLDVITEFRDVLAAQDPKDEQ